MEEDDIFDSDELSMDEDTSSYIEDTEDNESRSDPATGTIVGLSVVLGDPISGPTANQAND